MNVLREAGDRMVTAARAAMAAQVAPESEHARALVEDHGTALAAARGGVFDDASRRAMRERIANHDLRNTRYWELVAAVNGTPAPASTITEWNWIRPAMLHHLPASG